MPENPRPIEAMPKPGFDQKGWLYAYDWTGLDYRVLLTDPRGDRYEAIAHFPTMTTAHSWLQHFLQTQVPFSSLPPEIRPLGE
ncbi:MAG: hypothetical protein MUF49_24285 [Oculatellaceae cyanobacterium Prado106]|jgi:hypothetical protein|nr:hypothetical protein [Oculatellaceae cyanobacterium Prado106]